ncbi:MAG: error-prone DNA polymerase [Pirellulales bacterium]
MPNPSIHSKRKPPRAGRCYAELHCKTNFSFLEGASHPDELVAQAAELGYSALAITDRNSLAGVVRAHAAAKDSGFKLLIGAEITPIDAPAAVLLATDRAAYGRLCRLITLGRRRAAKGECKLTIDDVANHSDGLIATIVPSALPAMPPPSDGEARVPSGSDRRRPSGGFAFPNLDCETSSAIADYCHIFSDRCYLAAELHHGADDRRRLDDLIRLSKRAQVPLVAAGDVHYHVPQRMALQHMLTAIRRGTTVAELGKLRMPNAQRHLRQLEEVRAIFHQVPDAVQRTVEIADRCAFSLNQLRYEYPVELSPKGETPMRHLRRLAYQGAERRYVGSVPEKVRRQLEHELGIIEELHYEAFFLTVHDLVEFAKSQSILCQGRGSAANSTVCYCLGVTAVDPLETDLLFERFVSRERNEAPDIDVDFEHERREEVLQYIYDKYGRDRAGMTAVVSSYRIRSAVRDVGKAIGLSLDRVDALAKNIDFRTEHELLEKRCSQSGVDPQSRLGRQLVMLANQLVGFPRHLSQHVGGMVITHGALCELTPVENAAMNGRTVIQWDKDDLDELGILKVDCLGLGMLTAIHKCFDLIEKHHGRRFAISDFTGGEDENVYAMISRADTVGVFQIESRAQMSMLPRLRPGCFYDLVIEVAIVRPGPIQGNMVHPYLRRRELSDEQLEQELQADTCLNVELRKVLERTLGVPLFQEQAMQVAMVAAGFSPGEADQLRRAMGAWRRPGLIDNFRKKLIDGMLGRGFPEDFAERVFQQIRGFGEYGFPESHAASFARLIYVSAWLKHYYPAAFAAAIINSQPMGFYAPAQLIRDAIEHDVEVLPIDINDSCWDCTLERLPLADCGLRNNGQFGAVEDNPESGIRNPEYSLRLGMRLVRGLSPAAAGAIEQARVTKFDSIADLTERTGLDRPVVECLAAADVFGSLRLDRRGALWQALDQAPKPEEQPLFVDVRPADSPLPVLPKLTAQEEVFADYRAAGLSLRQHPISFYRQQLDVLNVVPTAQLAECKNNRPVRVAGLVLMRQRPSTANGITFVTLEDETGICNLIIHARTWQRFDLVARRSSALIAGGKLERKNEVLHVIVHHLEEMTARLSSLNHRSRDFR